jgi:hypothetical protein
MAESTLSHIVLARSLRLAAAATLFVAQLAAAAPLREARLVAARDCCARRCHHTQTTTGAAHCCRLAPLGDEHAAATAGMPAPALAPTGVAPVTPVSPPSPVILAHRTAARAGPLFLALGVLRL